MELIKFSESQPLAVSNELSVDSYLNNSHIILASIIEIINSSLPKTNKLWFLAAPPGHIGDVGLHMLS